MDVVPHANNDEVRLVYDATTGVTTTFHGKSTGVTTTNHGKSRRLVSRADRFQRRNASAEQSDVDRQLSFISTRPDEPNTLDHPFRYDLRAGAGSRVYIVDQGIFDGAQEWETRNSANPHARRDRIEWMFAEPYSTHQKEDPDSHGTCVLSVAVGYEFGTAKDADITVVATGSNYLEYERTLDAYSQILDDINRKGLQNKAVVVEAADTAIDPDTANERERSFMDYFAALLRALTTTWATAVVVSQAGEEPCPGPPCIFGDPAHEPHVPLLITVDGADIDSGDYYFLDDDERDKWTTVFGPGVDLDADDERPDHESLSCIGNRGEIIDSFGSSLATGMVGGLMAYYESLGLSSAQARERLLSNAYKRNRDGPAMIWNGYT